MPNTDRWGQPLWQWLPDGLGVLFVVGAALAVLVPTLAHGSSIGPFDLLANSGLTKTPGVSMHNPSLADQIEEMIPWSQLAWTQVHQGHLPLWNPYSALGMPLAFNWQAATFSLPALIGYLFPLRLAYTVQVVLTAVIAGTGVYTLGRVMRLGVLGSAFAATAFELSGPVMAWLGWPISGVMSWMGWIFAAAVLVMRGRHRVTGVVMLALSLALAVYAGEADALTVLVLACIGFASVLFLLKIPALGGSGPVLRPLGDLAVASAAGAMLAAPLALPGFQLVSSSVRGARASAQADPAPLAVHLLLEGYNGSPLAGHVLFEPHGSFYQDSLAYVGVIVLALAVVAVAMRWRRPEVVALGVVAVASAAAAFVPPVLSLLSLVPHLSAVNWGLALVPLALSVAALGGVGLDVLVDSWRRRDVRLWAAGSFATFLFLLGGIRLVSLSDHLTAMEASERTRSFVWPLALCLLGLLVIGALSLVDRRLRASPGRSPRLARVMGRWAGALLLAGEAAFLLVTGAPMLSSSPTYLTPTASVDALKSAVGPSLVGWGVASCLGVGPTGRGLGVAPDANVAFELHELAVYDPITPKQYDRSWKRLTGDDVSFAEAIGFTSWYCPAVTNATWARVYGVSYILEKAGVPGPTGAVFDKMIGNETLYRVPGAALATLTPALSDGHLPDAEAPGSPVAVNYPNPSTWRLTTHASTPQILRLRLTDVPGWHASIDGRPLALVPFAGVMLQARLPAGRYTVQLTYWPSTFTLGIILAVVGAVGLSGLVALSVFRRYRGRWLARTPDRAADGASASEEPLDRFSQISL